MLDLDLIKFEETTIQFQKSIVQERMHYTYGVSIHLSCCFIYVLSDPDNDRVHEDTVLAIQGRVLINRLSRGRMRENEGERFSWEPY